jgi:hypothetical protein
MQVFGIHLIEKFGWQRIRDQERRLCLNCRFYLANSCSLILGLLPITEDGEDCPYRLSPLPPPAGSGPAETVGPSGPTF